MPELVWLVMGVVFFGVEATRGDFYLFGFGLGAIAAALLASARPCRHGFADVRIDRIPIRCNA